MGALRVWNFSVASITHLLKACPTCDDAEINRRHAICKDCQLYVKKSDNVGYCSHAKCGCSISNMDGFISKLAWADQHCPIKKW